MRNAPLYLLVLAAALDLVGCASSEAPQVGADVKKQFAGAPMPPDAAKKFQESMQKNKEMTQQQAQNGGKH